jgi:hypothetical protein
LRVLQSNGSVCEINVSKTMVASKLTKHKKKRMRHRSARDEKERHSLEDKSGQYSIEQQIEEVKNKLDRRPNSTVLPSSILESNQGMDKRAGQKIILFLSDIQENFIEPLQKYELALKHRRKGWDRLWNMNQKSWEKLNKHVLVLRSKLSDTDVLSKEVAQLSDSNIRKANDTTDLILKLKNHIREEEKDWFEDIHANKRDWEVKKNRFDEWMSAERMVWVEETVAEVMLFSMEQQSNEMTVIGSVPSSWDSEKDYRFVKHVVRWKEEYQQVNRQQDQPDQHDQHEQMERLIVDYFQNTTATDLGEQSCTIKINMNLNIDLQQGTKLKVVKQTLTFTKEKMAAINEERKRIRREGKRAQRHRGGGSKKRNDKTRVDHLKDEKYHAMKHQLEKIERDVRQLKQQMERLN